MFEPRNYGVGKADDTRRVSVPLTEEEHRFLKQKALDQNTTVTNMIRKIMKAKFNV